ncbi:MAG TPA: hypothetical protein VGM90_22100 [Kofleriaceae bacterium]|jgi:hypothetical protein
MKRFAFVVLAACGGSHGSAPSSPTGVAHAGADPVSCTWITAAEVEQATGKKVVIAPDQTDASSCDYAEPDTGKTVAVITRHPAGDFAAIAGDAFAMSNAPADVAGIGDKAQYAEFKNGAGSNLVFVKNGNVIVLGGSEHETQYQALARLALPRL